MLGFSAAELETSECGNIKKSKSNSNSSHFSSVKSPLELLRLSSPPHTPTTVAWDEVLSLAGGDGQFEEDDEGNIVISEAFEAADLVPLHFTVDYIEVIEVQVYGKS